MVGELISAACRRSARRLCASIAFATFISVSAGGAAHAAEYCVDKYNGQISAVNSELGNLIVRQAAIDQRVRTLITEILELSKQLSDVATTNPSNTAEIKRLAGEIERRNREKASLEVEGYRNIDRIAQLKSTIPAGLQGELRGCVEATKDVNQFVNLAIQSIAILSTGGASLALPPKALYVDMSAVLNGYPTGGSSSVINEAREAALNALGIGGQNNDIGRVVRDPVRAVCRVFGC